MSLSVRTLLAILVPICLFSSCERNRYRVEGTADLLDNQDTLLLVSDLTSGQPSDTIVIEEHSFSFEGTADSAKLCQIYSQSRPEVQAYFFAEPGETVHIKLKDSGLSRIWGSKANDAWQELTDLLQAYEQQVEALLANFYDDDMSEEGLKTITARIEELEKEKEKWLKDFSERNKDNALGRLLNENLQEDNQ